MSTPPDIAAGTLVYARLGVVVPEITMPWGPSVLLTPVTRDGQLDPSGVVVYLERRHLISPREARQLMEQRP